jgi:hypothetical protein
MTLSREEQCGAEDEKTHWNYYVKPYKYENDRRACKGPCILKDGHHSRHKCTCGGTWGDRSDGY